MYRKKRDGIIATILFHLILIFILIFSGLSVPLPLPAEEGILLNFGYDEEGIGNIESGVQPQSQPDESPSTSQPQTQQSSAEEAVTNTPPVNTQDFEEAPSLPEAKKEASKPKEEEKKTEEVKKEESKPVEKKEEPKPREVNQRALYPGKSNTNNQSSEGIAGGEGNQGVENGETGVPNYQTGESFGGGGTSFSLAGRKPISLPKPEYNFQEEGIVVVEITVDRDGKVINAVPGVKGSTTLDAYLCEVAKKAALKSRFDVKSDASFYQKGTITYRFELQ